MNRDCNMTDICERRIFMNQARVILAKLSYSLDWELEDRSDWHWLDQRAYLVFEPKPLRIKLSSLAQSGELA